MNTLVNIPTYYIDVKYLHILEENKIKCLQAFDKFFERYDKTKIGKKEVIKDLLGLDEKLFKVDFDLESSYIELVFQGAEVYLNAYLVLVIYDEDDKRYDYNDWLLMCIRNGNIYDKQIFNGQLL